MFLAMTCFLTGTNVVLGLCWHCSGVTATVCKNTFGDCGERKSSFCQLFVTGGKKAKAESRTSCGCFSASLHKYN